MLDTTLPTTRPWATTGCLAFSDLARSLHGDNSIVADDIEKRVLAMGGTVVAREVEDDEAVHPLNRWIRVIAEFVLSGQSAEFPTVYEYEIHDGDVDVFRDDDEVFSGSKAAFSSRRAECFPQLVEAAEIYKQMGASDAKVRDLREQIEELEEHLALEEEHRSQLAQAWSDADENNMVLRP